MCVLYYILTLYYTNIIEEKTEDLRSQLEQQQTICSKMSMEKESIARKTEGRYL